MEEGELGAGENDTVEAVIISQFGDEIAEVFPQFRSPGSGGFGRLDGGSDFLLIVLADFHIGPAGGFKRNAIELGEMWDHPSQCGNPADTFSCQKLADGGRDDVEDRRFDLLLQPGGPV